MTRTRIDYIRMIDNNIGARPAEWRKNLHLIAVEANHAVTRGDLTHAERSEISQALNHAITALTQPRREPA